MPETKTVLLCKECAYFRPFPDSIYGSCTRLCKTATVQKTNDYCSSAQPKIPAVPEIDDHDVSGLLDD